MILTDEQQQAAQSGHPVRIMDDETRQRFVLLREDLYDRVRSFLESDDLTSDEKLLLLAESGDRAGWAAPEMDAYDDYDRHRPNP